MADLCSLYQNVPYRDRSIQACADCLQVLANNNTTFKSYLFTDLFDISGGTQPPKSKFVYEAKVGYTRFLQIRDFASESTLTYIPNAKNNKICQEDDLLLGRYGASVGKILTGKSGAYNVACAKILFKKPQLVERKFLFYWLHSSYFQNYLTSISRSAQGGFNKNDLSRISISIPNIDIQKQLVDILERIDESLIKREKINLRDKSNDTLIRSFVSLIGKFLSLITDNEDISTELTHQLNLVKQLRQAFLREAMQGKLVPQDPNDEPASVLLEKIKAEKERLIKEKKIKKDKPLPPITEGEIPFEIPENWVWCRLKGLVEITGGGTPSKGRSDYWNGDIPWISPKDMKSLTVSDSELKVTEKGVNNSSAKMIPEGSLLVVGRSGILKRMIPVAINQIACTVNQDMKVLIPFFKNMNRFIQYLLFGIEDILLKDYVKFGMTVHSLKYSEFELMPIPLPPRSEQQRIVAKLDELMKYCDELEASIKESQQQNEMLLQQVLREALEPPQGHVEALEADRDHELRMVAEEGGEYGA